MSLAQLAITVIVLAGIVGIVLVIVRQTGVQIPQWVITIAWIIVAVLVGVWAIKFLISMT